MHLEKLLSIAYQQKVLQCNMYDRNFDKIKPP